jgi:flagellar motor switch protein FliG
MRRAVAPEGADGSLQLLTGAQRAAALLMILGEEDGKAIWSELSEAEVKQICVAMAELGPVRGDTVAQIAEEFMGELGAANPVRGSLDRAQELLSRVFPEDRVSLHHLRGPGGQRRPPGLAPAR